MDKRLILIFLDLLVLSTCQDIEFSSSSISEWEDLGEECDCSIRECPELPDSCPHGLVTAPGDECGCCHICGNGEWQYCDPNPLEYPEYFSVILPWEVPPEQPLWSPSIYKFGRCGWGLTCKLKFDMGPKDSLPVFVCQCQDDTIVCGSDGRTYETPCSLREAAVEKGSPLVVKKKQMCIGAPRITSSSRNLTQTIELGKTLSVGCEARSNPLATITWFKNGYAIKDTPNDRRFSIKQRPGPGMYVTTGFIQVFNVDEEDGGVYECTASNDQGSTTSSGTITIVNIV